MNLQKNLHWLDEALTLLSQCYIVVSSMESKEAYAALVGLP